ncbi:MAG: HAD-IC family P-type ATPase [Rubrobacter sp.]|nr:HAD-IC family P-type ATPase [Rubrobacter sp.]
MSPAVAEAPRVVHAVPGRVRVSLPGWDGGGSRRMELRLREVAGVRDARANPLTRNVLIRFDPSGTDEGRVLEAVRALEPEPDPGVEDEPEPPPARRERCGSGRARIPVRGLDRDPELARRVVEGLERWPTVRSSANPLTGRVLVEFDACAVRLEDLTAEVARLEPPELSGEERPADPLDPSPLTKSATRTVGAAVGLGVLGFTRGRPPGASGPAVAAGVISILEGFPAVRERLRGLLGPDAVDLAFGAANIALLTLSGGSLGLAVAGLGALGLFVETRARRDAWRRYEEGAGNEAPAQPGAVVRLEAGERSPLAAEVIEGYGTAVGRDGLPETAAPGESIAAGSRLYGGPFVLELRGGEPFTPEPRVGPEPGILGRYLRAMGPSGFAYAVATAVLTRSLARTFAALLLVNPRAAIVGAESADAGASARALRAGATVVGTRPGRGVRLPGAVLIDDPRALTDGFEVGEVLSLSEDYEGADLLSLAAAVSSAAGSPWGGAFGVSNVAPDAEGRFDGERATARVEGVTYSLRPVEEGDPAPEELRLRTPGGRQGESLLLYRGRDERPLGLVTLRPRLAPGVAELVNACGHHGVEVGLLAAGDLAASREVARRAGVPLLPGGDAVEAVRARQEAGSVVAFVSDGAHAGAAFAACDLAVGLTEGGGPFPARADLLAPDLEAVAAVVEAGARREKAVRDSVLLSMAAAGFGAVWGLKAPGVERASYPVSVAALGALVSGWARLRGGERQGPSISQIDDPRPERWGRLGVEDVLRALDTTGEGLSSARAGERRQVAVPVKDRNKFLGALGDQIRSPLTGILAAGAGLSLVLGAPGDVVMISAMIVANSVAGAWQERQADRTTEELERMGTVTARVLRDGGTVSLPADEIVSGDVLLLAPGDRVAADARLLEAQGLEVDETALTGESLPVSKGPDGATDESRIVLEGSDVTVGTGRAVVVAVGRGTRMGSIAAALAEEEAPQTGLTVRLNQMLRQVLPVIVGGGAVVAASGLLWRRPLLPQLAIGASVAIAAVPEGLPLLAKVGEAAVARRLAGRSALVRRLSAVEALGRVDVACADKTGTLTEGRLVLRLVADVDGEGSPHDELPGNLRHVLLTAALAGPRPDAPGANMDPTDVVVARAAQVSGLGDELQAEREAELQFKSSQGFHAAVIRGRLCVEGAAEALVSRCTSVRRGGEDRPLGEEERRDLLQRSRTLAERGLRVLMVAEGVPEAAVEDPQGLTALGFLGITDPLRSGVEAAVRRCEEAGVRVVMLTGDHPATARTIAREAGLSENGEGILTGPAIAGLDDEELDRRLERAAVIARVTPLDKLRIVESLQRQGHVVAMTGDGVNDGPALRLANVGVAMGRGGTEVARQAADVVLADDDFSTLVETLVEGRSFWRNIRRALSLLLGGNLGELGLLAGASVLSPATPLTSAQILAMNLITDVLPALAVALQQPEHRDLSGLNREGAVALERSLRSDVLRRGVATAVPSLAAYLIALHSSSLPQARAVAYSSIVVTQLAQTLDVGRAEGGLSRSVTGAVAGSALLFAATFAARPLRAFLNLTPPTPLGWALVVASTLAAVLLGRRRSYPTLPATETAAS